jgi:hypothetical protein
MTALIRRPAITLQKQCTDLATLHDKIYCAQLKAEAHFEQKHRCSIQHYKSVLAHPVATLRAIPYVARTQLDLPPLDETLSKLRAQVEEIRNSCAEENDEESIAHVDDWGQSSSKVRRRSRTTAPQHTTKSDRTFDIFSLLFSLFIAYYYIITDFCARAFYSLQSRNSHRHIAQSFAGLEL